MNIKTSLVGLVLLLSVGFTAVVNASAKAQATTCSQYPNAGGIIAQPFELGCFGGAKVCCYRIPDNFIYYKP